MMNDLAYEIPQNDARDLLRVAKAGHRVLMEYQTAKEHCNVPVNLAEAMGVLGETLENSRWEQLFPPYQYDDGE